MVLPPNKRGSQIVPFQFMLGGNKAASAALWEISIGFAYKKTAEPT